MLQGSGVSKIHIGQYGCRDICLIIIEKQEYLIKQGESSGQFIVYHEIRSLYKEWERPDLFESKPHIHIDIFYLALLLLLC